MMKKSNWLMLIIIIGVVIMLSAFLVVPDKYPWYYEVLLFNIGLGSWVLVICSKKTEESEITIKLK